ncbi:hypothetical protein N7474_005804 [Penicillium riverlandense]|uniref:uncharacterized protein n=1 Tax=Penicillium riverlandense TaxID=1903569 RepID=UPI0025493260|nr:uncharacterized protein N7474_005804 [Penicillium riverlandense]KAJ5820213.1 hypothetical protein N7474_005804 [Penicillium riverlandense]
MLENDVLEVFGQTPFLYKLYTQICCVFPVCDPSAHDAIVDTLAKGLARLAGSFPWLAGQVINEGASEGNTGVYRIIPGDKLPLVVKDLRHDPSGPTMDALRQANYPFSMLDEEVIAPCMTLNIPGSSTGLAKDSAPVFCVQANFITGGLMLTLVGQHNVMDMTGQGNMIRLLSKACHNEPFTSEEVTSGNLSRATTIPLLDDSYQPGPELAEQIVKPLAQTTETTAEPLSQPPKCTWAYLTFSAKSLAALKSLASKHITCEFISTDDAISSFLWQCIIRSRLPRLEPSAKALITRSVNVRRHLGVPSGYPGLAQNLVYHRDTVKTLAEEPLGTLASQFRSAIDPKKVDLAFNTRALATFLSRSPDKTVASVGATVDSKRDFMISSWANIDCYELDFNLGLGTPEAVRRPCLTPIESLGYLMPKSPSGEMAAGICLREEDWERLRADEEFVKYGKYVG